MAEPHLEVTDVTGQRTVAVDKLPFRLGRGAGNDLLLTSGEVSRMHAEIVAAGEGYAIRDCGSRHGTFVDGAAVHEAPLEDGARVRLGRGGAELTFRCAADETTLPPSRRVETIGDLRQVAVLLEGLRALSSARVLDDVLVLVMDSAIAVSGAERGFIMLADEAGQLEFTMGRSRDRQPLPGSGFQTSRKIPEEVFRTGKTRIEADLLDGDLADAHQGTVALGIRHVLCVPLRLVRYADRAEPESSGEGHVGVLYLDSREKGTLLASSTGSSLETLANEAAVAIENAKLYREALEKARLDQEMRTAAGIQQALLPTRRRTGAFFAAAAETLPCRAIGGDFFDYFDLGDGRLGLVLGDVAGKGPPAALLSAFTQGSLQAQAAAAGARPASILAAVNDALVRRGIAGRFVTLFFAVLSPDGRLTYCNAGHNPPMLLGTHGAVRRLDVGGLVLGLFEGVDFSEATVELAPGDSLVVFSDGVSEAMSSEGEEYGDDRLLASLTAMPAGDAASRLAEIFADVERFTAGAAQHDDVTAMVAIYRGT
ncbi:MAG: SpoIIE family protein phosphatase [Acidobacteria bacterium]|nr:SpoIIE family protein phosphatase [Acidobacteriota bacterium]